MLDPLRAVSILDHVGRATKAFFHVAALQNRFAQQIRPALGMDEWRTWLQRCVRIGNGLQHFILNIDEFRRRARQSLAVGYDTRDDVASAPSLLTNRDKDRPVVFDEADVAIARHVGRGHHAMHAR